MQVLIVLSVGVSIITILSACFILRRVKKQIMEMTEALHDVKEEMETGGFYRLQMS